MSRGREHSARLYTLFYPNMIEELERPPTTPHLHPARIFNYIQPEGIN